MSRLEVKRVPDGRILAMRLDRRPLTLQDREEAKRLIQSQLVRRGINLEDVLNTFFMEEDRRGWLYLEVQWPENYPQGPLTVGPGLRITDVAKSAERTIEDLLSYITAQNKGAACGVKAEIRKLQ